MIRLTTPILFAALAALPLVGRGQMTYLSSDMSVSGRRLITSTGGGSGSAAIQTFSSFSSLTDVSWTLTNSNPSAGAATFNGYIAQWSGKGIVANTLTSIGSLQLSLAGSTSGALDFANLSLTLDPNLTYALIVSYASGTGNFKATVGTNPGGSFFGSGGITSSPVTADDTANFASTLASGTLNSPNKAFAYTMSVNGTFTPVPEPKTAAAGLAALFIAALVGHRVWQRRKLAAAPGAVLVN